MKLRDIYKDKKTNVFKVINHDSDNELDYEIEATEYEIIPEVEGLYIVKALEVKTNKITECYMDMIIPERISDNVIKKGLLGKVKISEYYPYEGIMIPAIASDCYGVYDLYYSKENPQIGIEVLKNGLEKAKNKEIILDEIGYILRDENRNEEAIEAFKQSLEYGYMTQYSYLELSCLYERIGNINLKEEYYKKFIEKGGDKLTSHNSH
jgi:tetratricopeptide (TPR) repeat protein